MDVGVTIFAENYSDWDRFERGATDEVPEASDAQMYEDELAYGDLIEPLGFDSIWAVEHHFSPYLMIPNPLQLLTYFAARTERVNIGTMVVVLPWHDPLRLAEEIAVLDNMLKDRRLTIGVGRGAGRREFEAFDVPMSESRERFDEVLEIVRRGLTQERFSYEGKFYSIPETTIRPRPRSSRVVDDMVIAWMSPKTLPIGANGGLGMLFVNNKDWVEYEDDVRKFNEVRGTHGWGPKQPKVVVWVSCAETEGEAWEMALSYMAKHQDAARRHYELEDSSHFEKAGGYEYYASLADKIASQTPEERDRAFCEAQVFGTPEQCYEKLVAIQQRTSAEEFILSFKYGSLPLEMAERNIRLFSETVLPRLHAHAGNLAAAAAG